MVNRSYRIGYNFQRRVKKYMEGKGWNVIARPKSQFPDLHCWRYIPPIIACVGEEKTVFGYNVIEVECKVNKYLTKDEKQQAKDLLENKKCSKFIVAYRDKRKLKFYEIK
jgi:Holliday junction resolvase